MNDGDGVFCLSLERLLLLSEATSASYYMLSSTFAGDITFIVAIWALSFSCCLILHLVRILN